MELRVILKSHKKDEALRRFPPELRKCYFDGERVLKYFKTYSTALCEWERFTNETLKICGCVKFSMPRDSETPICNLTSLECVANVSTSQQNCLPPCIDLKYSFKIDKSNFERNIFEKKVRAE
jgi:acid-sensing ion channel, other